MMVVDDLAGFSRPLGGSAVSIGAYDGVHLGHQQLLARLRAVAAERSCASAVVTFDRHPALVVRPDSAPMLLTDLETRLELLAATGIDYTVVLHFDAARSREPAEDFVRTVLVDALDAKVVAVGRDFHFGHNREGNVAFLERLGPTLGFDVLPVELFDDGRGGSVKVSSTRVRTALAEGDVVTAAALLGRPHLVRGPVVATGHAGFPTATVAVPQEICLPADGLYAGWYRGPDAIRHAAAVSVTGGPAGRGHPVEAYLLDGGGVGARDTEAVVEFAARLGGSDRPDAGTILADRVGREMEAILAALR
ncbi:MAG TPA: riboflavin kinase [Acidimicrobiia bacterium]|nr:riboflavin kinase [Acidimicrobiia bacterium]